MHIKYHIMTKWKHVFRNFYKLMKNEKLQCLASRSIQLPESILCRSTFGSDYSFESPWVCPYQLFTSEFGDFLCISLGWNGTILLDLSRNFRLSTPVDAAVLDHPPATINEHMVNLLCHTTSVGIPSPAITLRSLKRWICHPKSTTSCKVKKLNYHGSPFIWHSYSSSLGMVTIRVTRPVVGVTSHHDLTTISSPSLKKWCNTDVQTLEFRWE